MKTEKPTPKKRAGFRLFKRGDDGREMPSTADGYRARNYYFKFEYRGQRFLRCLETNDATIAQARAKAKAKEIKDSLSSADYQRLAKTRMREAISTTVGQIIELYKTSPVDANNDTRTTNIQSLRLVLSRTLHTDQPDTLNAGRVDGATGRQWFADARDRVRTEPDQGKQQSMMQSANSRYAQARSLFTPRALQYYKDNGITIPSLTEFSQTFNTHQFTRLTDNHYNPPNDQVIADTLKAWPEIQDRDLFMTIGLEFAFGMRKGEVGQAKWGWLQTRQGYPVVDGTGHFKNGSNIIQVRALDPFYTILRARAQREGWITAPTDYMITGSDSAREEAIFRSVGLWMRSLGWETKKTNHALRAWSGSQIAMKYGIYDAQVWLRHSTVKLTEDHYSYFIRKFKPENPDTLPVTWATAAPAAFTPQILPAASA